MTVEGRAHVAGSRAGHRDHHVLIGTAAEGVGERDDMSLQRRWREHDLVVLPRPERDRLLLADLLGLRPKLTDTVVAGSTLVTGRSWRDDPDRPPRITADVGERERVGRRDLDPAVTFSLLLLLALRQPLDLPGGIVVVVQVDRRREPPEAAGRRFCAHGVCLRRQLECVGRPGHPDHPLHGVADRVGHGQVDCVVGARGLQRERQLELRDAASGNGRQPCVPVATQDAPTTGVLRNLDLLLRAWGRSSFFRSIWDFT